MAAINHSRLSKYLPTFGFQEVIMRIQYMKAVIEAELILEQLTPKEQIDLLLQLVKDVNSQYPDYNLQLIRIKEEESDNSLDW